MSLIEGLHQGLHGQSFHGFYILCRTLLVKTESDLDKFDEMFHRYFEAVDPVKISQEIRELTAQPDVAAKVFAAYFQKNDMPLGEAMLQIEERLAEARELLYCTGGGKCCSCIRQCAWRDRSRPGNR